MQQISKEHKDFLFKIMYLLAISAIYLSSISLAVSRNFQFRT